MKKYALLLSGLILLLVQHSTAAIQSSVQYVIFVAGILLLGVPHGAADLLVAARNADLSDKRFSKLIFFRNYLGRLALFASVLYFFPVAGNILFIFFAAYHFGETDLNQFKTNTLTGKLFVISYGMIILSVMLLHHFDEVKPIYQMFASASENAAIIDWLGQHRYHILSANGIIFFITTFIYFLTHKQSGNGDSGGFLLRLAVILFILFNLPMLLGFTFYFVVWHSLLSINNIIIYLRQENNVNLKTIARQILLYSFLAIAGIGIFGLTGSVFINENAVTGYIVISLAVLTAPHMEIMYAMYAALRKKNKEVVPSSWN